MLHGSGGGHVLDNVLFELRSWVTPPGRGRTTPSESARLEPTGGVGEIVLPIFSNEYRTILTKGLLVFLVHILGETLQKVSKVTIVAALIHYAFAGPSSQW